MSTAFCITTPYSRCLSGVEKATGTKSEAVRGHGKEKKQEEERIEVERREGRGSRRESRNLGERNEGRRHNKKQKKGKNTMDEMKGGTEGTERQGNRKEQGDRDVVIPPLTWAWRHLLTLAQASK